MTLVVALAVIAVLSLVGAYSVSNAAMETRIAGNYQLAAQALAWAEVGIEIGRSTIANAVQNPVTAGGELCADDMTLIKYPAGNDWKVAVCVEHLRQEITSGSSQNYQARTGGMVVYGKLHYYRITATSRILASDGVTVIGSRSIDALERILENEY